MRVLVVLLILTGCAVPTRNPDCHVDVESGELRCIDSPPAEDCRKIDDYIYVCGDLKDK